MSSKDYYKRISKLRNEIEKSIREIVLSNNNNNIFIPFYYDEDEIDDDIETLIEDGYNVIIGDEPNLCIQITTYSGECKYIDVVAVSFSYGEVEIISKESNFYHISQVSRLVDLAEIYHICFKKAHALCSLDELKQII